MEIYTDGACEPNPGPCGSGIVVYNQGRPVGRWYGLYTPRGTNNIAELNAIYFALILGGRDALLGHSVTIFSDSQYCINSITKWASGWEKRGWKKKDKNPEIKNLELIQKIYYLYNFLSNVQLKYIKGHSGIEGNELADKMAELAILTKQENLLLFNKGSS